MSQNQASSKTLPSAALTAPLEGLPFVAPNLLSSLRPTSALQR
jgi:hypothetical protein